MASEDFTLNHIQIQDTVTKLYWAFDTHQVDNLRSDVFATEILVDYSALFGGEPNLRGNEELAGIWKELMDKLETSQHIVTGILPVFSTPLNSESFRGPVDVSANVTVYLRKKTSDGSVLESRSGGRMELEVSRKDGSGPTENPWRISKLRAAPGGWEDGSKEFWQAQ